MTFANTTNRSARAPAIIGVVTIHAALGVAIVTGLAGGVAGIIERDILEVWDIPIPPPAPPPPPDPAPKPDTRPTRDQAKVFIPPTDRGLNTSKNEVAAGETPTSFGKEDTGPIGNPGAGKLLGDPPRQPVLLDPVAPLPRGNSNAWVTDNDYRSTWINRGWEGVAAFRLTIDANGRVDSCIITQSTGHAALDEATCRHVQRRARFVSAKGNQGEPVSGTFSSAVRWQIPE